MNTLDSPLEALAINYLSYGVLTAINNFWAWIAVFTAAVSFWKIRANNSVSASIPTIADHPHHDTTSFLAPAKQVLISQTPSPPCATVDELPSISEAAVAERPEFGGGSCMNEGTVKGKYTLYFGGVEQVIENEENRNEDYDEVDGGMRRCEDGWEAVLRMKTEELGWYRYQDLTVFDGSVVRLWDGCGRRNGYGSVYDSAR